MKNAVIVSALIAVIAGAAASYLIHAQVSGTAAEADRLTGIADSFPSEPNWNRVEDSLSYDGYFCLPDSGCVNLQRRWASVPGVDPADLQSRIDAAGWELDLSGTCTRQPKSSGKRTLCSAEGTVQGYSVSLDLISASSTEPLADLVLNIH